VTVTNWLASAVADAARAGIPQLKASLETLARATEALRAASWNDDASGKPTSNR
jgi:hypothetical protein